MPSYFILTQTSFILVIGHSIYSFLNNHQGGIWIRSTDTELDWRRFENDSFSDKIRSKCKIVCRGNT